MGMCLFASPASASGVHSVILPWLDLPADTVLICNGTLPPPTIEQCWNPPALEHWVLRMDYPDAVAWVRGQMADVGWEEHSTEVSTTTDPNGGLHVAVEMPQRTWWHHDQFGVDVNHLNSINTDLWVNSFPADQ